MRNSQAEIAAAILLGLLPVEAGIVCIYNSTKLRATLHDIIVQNINPIHRTNHMHHTTFVFQLTLAIAFFSHVQFALQNFCRKISRAARGFQKARVKILCFALDQIKHRAHFTTGGIDFAVRGDASFRDDLLFGHSRCHVPQSIILMFGVLTSPWTVKARIWNGVK